METSATPSKVAVALNPVSGFCVKSRAANDTLVHLTASDDNPTAIQVAKGRKIFVNIAWDVNVPSPPPATVDAIKRAMHGSDIDNSTPEAWFIPVVLSHARQDSDKAGQPALVFDTVLNPSIKSLTLKDADFKNFVIELVFQRIEAQTTLVLSRQIGTPNIPSKGKPQARRVLVSTTLYSPDHTFHRAPPTLVQEIPDRTTAISDKILPKGILKTLAHSSKPISPTWSWTQQESHIRIVIDVPGVTRTIVSESTLDLEPRRIILHVPALYDLDLNLETSDAKLMLVLGKNGKDNAARRLKRMRSFNVDNARAEWRAGDKVIVLWA